MFGNKVGHLGRVGSLTLAQRVSAMFSRGEPGAWYDPSDMSTLFQDEAGTTPVTAVEQPVGRILDKSGRGNHATQATTPKRPIYSRRVNLFTDTEAFNAWLATTATVDSNVAMSPIGTLTADRINVSASSGSGVSKNISTVAASHEISVWARSEAGTRTFRLFAYNATDGVATSPDFVATTTWQKFTVTIPRTVNASSWYISNAASGPTAGALLIWGASLTLATDAHLPYQWVNTASDYDADPAKFPAYRRLDGVDDNHASATGGGGTAGFFFSAAITVMSINGWRILFSDAGPNTGYMVRMSNTNRLELVAGNGSSNTVISTGNIAVIGETVIVQAWDDGTNLNVKIGNGATASIARPVVSAGTAGYTMGQNNGVSSGYFDGRIYSTIYRKDSGLTQVQREAVALYQRQKARMP